MRYVEAAGVRVSAIGLGTWQFGSREWGYGSEYERTAVTLVRRALDLGINLVDTAEIYAFGKSERIVGEAIADRRDEVFLATKLLPVLPVGPVIRWRAEASATRLGVDAIDLYQLHWPNPFVPIGMQIDGLKRLVDDGLVHNVGVSNFPLGRWKVADAAMVAPVSSNQVSYSLADTGPQADLVPFAQANDRIVIAYSPLAQGLLAARYDADHKPSGGVRRGNSLFLTENLERAATLLDTLRGVAADHGVTPAQVALAWLVNQPNVVAIPGASSIEQLEANAAAAEIALNGEEMQLLGAAAADFDPIGGADAVRQMARERVGI